MFSFCKRHRHNCSRVQAALVSIAMLMPATVHAATADAMFELHPHCTQREGETDDWALGPIPSPGIVVETREASTRCTSFEVRDPQTLQTPELRVGDLLDIDVVIDNPSKQNIRRARAWLAYDPNMLEGISVEINDDFSLVTPDENDFSTSEGYVKLEATSTGKGPDTKKVLFARLQFRVLETNPIGTPITFHDPQPSGHTVIMAAEGDDEAYIQKEEPGVLLVRFAQDEVDTGDDTTGGDSGSIFDQVPNAPDPEPEPEPQPEPEPEPVDDNSCLRDADCGDGICVAGQCQEAQALLPNGSTCSEDRECVSGICGSGVCVPSLGDSNQNNNQNEGSNRTAFSLLQIRNVRVTTDGSSVFLAWDALQSSQLKAYNVYYGTVSGRYIQRRTIDKSETSITLRSLPLDTRYYFAVRGLSSQNEESAFSQEVSIVVGDPNSSTAPLTVGSLPRGTGTNPVANIQNGGQTNVPGETGAPSLALVFFLIAGVIGTSFASRRQLIVSHEAPQSND